MLLILSEQTDRTTNFVIEWLIYYNINFQRINGEVSNIHCNFKIDNTGTSITLIDRNAINYNLSIYTSFWYRRGDLYIGMPQVKNLKGQVKQILIQEWEQVASAIHYNLEKMPHLGSISKEKNHNKLISLNIASIAGLSVPETLITTSKESLSSFIYEKNSITKAIKNMFRIKQNNGIQSIGTKQAEISNINKLENTFAPTLVQKQIEKAYELRVFFIVDVFYSMAIFSQNDEQTRIDFRNYNEIKPNRFIPYKLPIEIENKLKEFIKISSLNTGSIDLIVTPENDFVFLEVNSVGQFGWLSSNCNYYIEEQIALHFKNQ